MDSAEITCPRCQKASVERFYGPCEACRLELRAVQAGEAKEAGAAAKYEPKSNVVPNQVATKE